MCYTERGFFLVVLNFKSTLPSKTFLCTAFLGNYCYSNEWSQAAWAFKVFPFIFPFNLLTSYPGLCWLPVKRGLPKRRVRESFTDQNVLLSEGWGLWNSCPTLTCPLLQASVCQSNTTTHTVIAALFGRDQECSSYTELNAAGFADTLPKMLQEAKSSTWGRGQEQPDFLPNDRFWNVFINTFIS